MARKKKQAAGMSATRRIILIAVLIASFGFAAWQFWTAWRLQDPAFQRQRMLGAAEAPVDPAALAAANPAASPAAAAPAAGSAGIWAIAAADRPLVDLDVYAAAHRPEKDGTREIIAPAPLRFAGRLRSLPERIEAEYIYTALSVMQVAPIPQINHTIFVESASGAVRAVYLRDDAVDAAKAAGLDAPVELSGFHVYTYSRGPAIVIDGLTRAG